MSDDPLISILLPVYNGGKYLKEAISSILSQTYENWELIIINDGSKDDSESVVMSFSDDRIHYYTQENIGLAKTLNKGIALARGVLIARQDQDDICLPARLERQVMFLEKNPHISLLGTRADIIEENIFTSRMHLHPLGNLEIKLGLLFDNFFVHSSVMMRKNLLLEVGGYSEDVSRQPPEDYELWSRFMRQGKQVANLPESLLVYREAASSMSRNGKNPFAQKLALLSAENLAWAADLKPNDLDILHLANLMVGNYESLSGLSLKKSWKVLNLAMAGLCKKNHANIQSVEPSILRWRKQFGMRYLDYRTGGFLSSHLQDSLRTFIKKLLFFDCRF